MGAMLRPFEVDELRARVAAGAAIGALEDASPQPCLGAALELSCAWADWRSAAGDGKALVEAWARTSDGLAQALALLIGSEISRPPIFSAPGWELRRIATLDDWLGTDAGLFQERFERSLREARFQKDLSSALTKCFAEVVDNILQHSSEREGEPALGIVGYHVEESWLTFGAADLGRGVLESLRENPAWGHLRTAHDALLATVHSGASRRKDESARDGGLQHLHQALMNRNGRIRFRSGDCCLQLDGTRGEHDYNSGRSAQMPGLQVSVICSLRGAPVERPLPGHTGEGLDNAR